VANWLNDEDCRGVVEEAWSSGVDGVGNLSSHLRGVACSLKDWSSNVLGGLEKWLKQAKRELERWRRAPICDESVGREVVWSFKVDRLEEQIDTYWGQRAHINWLQFGDRNTSFFHNACLERKRRNRIGKLKKEDRSWVEGEEEKKAFITNHFMQLFTAGIADVEAQKQQVLEAVEPRVTDAMNDHLTAEFSEEEIKRALDSIGDLKAPGPDGMPLVFFKKFWDVVGRKLTDEVMGVLHGGPMPEGWNETIISLIPKVDTPEKVTDLRPISLCNVVYKVVSKVLSSRLRDVLPDIISLSHSAFVPGRLISDNILVDYELTHFLLNKRGGEVGYAAIKLDMSKAYDRVEWHFLRDMMARMGFSEQWINLIMGCVTTVSYRIKVNGDLTENFVPERGLRQGDPLSPYLFLLCAEGFWALLQQAEQEGRLAGVKVCHQAPSVSHLLFADDSLIMIRATEGDANQLQDILDLYENCSGQMINKSKSVVLFSKNTGAEKRSEVCTRLQITKETMNAKYLGLPAQGSKSKAGTFAYIKDRI